MSFTRIPLKLAVLLFLFAACHAGESAKPPIPPPPADVASYAKEHGLEPAMSLDLGKGLKMEFVLIPAGKFLMGTPETKHEVTISKPFYMGRYEVTQEQYEAVMGTNPSSFKRPNLPVEKVSWNDAQEFCKKVSEKAGQTARLPTEAEWEFACRAGTTTAYYSGDTEADLGRVAWYGENSDSKVHPVGQKEPNAWGLYDMHGSVWEWCQDFVLQVKAGVVVNLQGPTDGKLCVLCGGSWITGAGGCGAAGRNLGRPSFRLVSFGFRVVAAPRTP